MTPFDHAFDFLEKKCPACQAKRKFGLSFSLANGWAVHCRGKFRGKKKGAKNDTNE